MFYETLKPYIEKSRQIDLKRGQILYHEGDSPESIYFVEYGLVGLFHISETGKETFLRVFGANSVLGHRSFFAEEPYHATSMALSPTRLTAVSKEECQRICQINPMLLREITKLLAKDLAEAELRLSGLQDKSAAQRIAESLIFLKEKYPDQTWTRKEIAEYSCSTFETVTRVMSKLEDQGLIEKKGRDFNILDEQRLLTSAFE